MSDSWLMPWKVQENFTFHGYEVQLTAEMHMNIIWGSVYETNMKSNFIAHVILWSAVQTTFMEYEFSFHFHFILNFQTTENTRKQN